jgi:hypothetical protein
MILPRLEDVIGLPSVDNVCSIIVVERDESICDPNVDSNYPCWLTMNKCNKGIVKCSDDKLYLSDESERELDTICGSAGSQLGALNKTQNVCSQSRYEYRTGNLTLIFTNLRIFTSSLPVLSHVQSHSPPKATDRRYYVESSPRIFGFSPSAVLRNFVHYSYLEWS